MGQCSAEQIKTVWPAPPDAARFEHSRFVSKAEDLQIERRWWKKVWDFLAGNEPPALEAPMGLHIGDDGKIFVVDAGRQEIVVFDPLKQEEYIWEGYGEKHFASPIDLDTDGSGRLYVTDSLAQTLYVLSEKGKPLRTIGQFERPTGIAVDRANKRVYVVDTLKCTIEVFTLEGEHVKSIGTAGRGDGEFNRPTFIALGKDENLYVSDSMNHRVQVLDKEGNFLRTFGRLGDQIGHFASPRGIGLDGDGNIYVVDTLFHSLQIFSPKGELLLVIGRYGGGVGEFSSPKDIAIDPKGNLYIADFYNRRLQVLRKLPDPEKRELP